MSNDESVREDGGEEATKEQMGAIERVISGLDKALNAVSGKSKVDFLNDVMEALAPLMPGLSETEEALMGIVNTANEMRANLGNIAVARVFARLKKATQAERKAEILSREPHNQEEFEVHLDDLRGKFKDPDDLSRELKKRFGDKIELTMNMAELTTEQAIRLSQGEDPRKVIAEADAAGKVVSVDKFREIIAKQAGERGNKMVVHMIPPPEDGIPVTVKVVDTSKPLDTDAKLDEHTRSFVAQARERREKMAQAEAQAILARKQQQDSESKGIDDHRQRGFSED